MHASAKPALAEGSRNMYPPGIGGVRANLVWSDDPLLYANQFKDRTLLKVYAAAGQRILVGSSAVGVGNADVVIYNPGRVTGVIGGETIPATADFSCQATRTGLGPADPRGRIITRTQELAGPQSVDGTGNLTGYVPCVYTAPVTGVYDLAIVGPSGANTNYDLSPPEGAIEPPGGTFNTAQQTTHVAAWDVTVRDNDSSIVDRNGRLFTYYLDLLAGGTSGNGKPINSVIYTLTTDGFLYETNLNGIDPNGFVLYGNRVGFLDADGRTPLNHDIVSASDILQNPQGGVVIARPEFPIFFTERIDPEAINNIDPPDPGIPGVARQTRIPLVPPTPTIGTFSFTGTVGGNNSRFGTGGTFNYSATTNHTYQMTISRDGVNFDPGNPNNRVLRGLRPNGSQAIVWDGLDNSGNFFPVNDPSRPYPVRLEVQAGNYHFPLLDSENSVRGGPSFRLLNAPGIYPPQYTAGIRTGFYDDRGYRTSAGQTVGTPGQILPGGTNPPTIPNSNPLIGFDTTSAQRAYGGPAVTDTNGFGDKKGLDLWTYFPSEPLAANLNIVDPDPDLTIEKIPTGNFAIGGQGVFTLRVSNRPSSSPTTGDITVTDTLPAGITFVSATGDGWSCSASGQVVTCTYPGPPTRAAIGPNGRTPDITLTVNVTPAAPSSIDNTAAVNTPGDPEGPGRRPNTNTVKVPIAPAPPVVPTINKSVRFLRDNDSTGTLTVGDDVEYTIVVRNPSSTTPISNLDVSDRIAPGLQVLQDAANSVRIVTANNSPNPDFAIAPGFPTGNFNSTGNLVRLTNTGTLGPGTGANRATINITYNARILPTAASQLLNTAIAEYEDPVNRQRVQSDASDSPTAPGSGSDDPNDPNVANPNTTGVGNYFTQVRGGNADPTIIKIVSPTQTPSTNPVGTKSVRVAVDTDTTGSLTPGDTVEYTVTYTNNSATLGVANFLVTDEIDTGKLRFVPGSYSFSANNGNAATGNITTVTGNPNYNGTTDTNLTNTTRGQLGAGSGNVVIKFRAVVTAPGGTTIINRAVGNTGPGTSFPTDAIASPSLLPDPLPPPAPPPEPIPLTPPLGGGNADPTAIEVLVPGPPRLRLVKRITNITRNGAALGGVDFGSFVSVNDDDKAPGWPANFLLGVTGVPATTPVQSGDEVEYTVYFLSDGQSAVNSGRLCDPIPTNTTFSPDSFGAGSGISLNRNGSPSNQTNAADADEGTFFSPLAPLPQPNACSNQNNSDGAAIVNLGIIPSTAGINYGFFRFRVKIN